VLGQGGEGGAVRLPEIMQVSPVSQRLPVGSWPSVKDDQVGYIEVAISFSSSLR